MTLSLKVAIAIWPLLVSLLARFFHRKQNSKKAWTGGPISWPKSFWLAYTTTSWFLLPLLFIAHEDLPYGIWVFYVFHLISWWLRGPLELVMIYKWFNWTPKYGIAHDLCHILGCIVCIFLFKNDFVQWPIDPISVAALVYILMVLFATSAEILFAAMFFSFRSQQEADENVYFASDDPKWIVINRVTLAVVVVVMSHLIWQTLFMLRAVFWG